MTSEFSVRMIRYSSNSSGCRISRQEELDEHSEDDEDEEEDVG